MFCKIIIFISCQNNGVQHSIHGGDVIFNRSAEYKAGRVRDEGMSRGGKASIFAS